MPSETSALLQRPFDSPLAWLNTGEKVFAERFLEHVQIVAKKLPEHAQNAINLCDSRYLFLVSICAVIYRKQCNLLPPNKNIATQQSLADRYSETYLLHDDCVDLASNIEQVSIADIDLSERQDAENFDVELDQIALISFTSGSTGSSKANIKTWRTLQQSSLINAQHMLLNDEDTFYHLATVPGQHMWGLETSVIMSLFANACLVDAKPLFPHDILGLLNKIPSPKVLISTPLHLRALSIMASDKASLPTLANILTATAPIDKELAQRLERQFTAQVREVYGCSEVGSMAFRHPAQTDVWSQFEGLDFQQSGEKITVNTAYLPSPVELDDRLEMLEHGEFKLKGRSADQIKIAGKRGSLFEVNKVLNAFDGVVDGVVIFPEQNRLVPRLAALVVLKETVDKETLLKYFRKHLDAAFVPRPILVVDKLPREENGKLKKTVLHDFYKLLVNK